MSCGGSCIRFHVNTSTRARIDGQAQPLARGLSLDHDADEVRGAGEGPIGLVDVRVALQEQHGALELARALLEPGVDAIERGAGDERVGLHADDDAAGPRALGSIERAIDPLQGGGLTRFDLGEPLLALRRRLGAAEPRRPAVVAADHVHQRVRHIGV